MSPADFKSPLLWIRLYPLLILKGSISEELELHERWIFCALLLLCGLSPVPGAIFLKTAIDGTLKGMPLASIAEDISVELPQLVPALEKLKLHRKIAIDKYGVIWILNWHLYQADAQPIVIHHPYERKFNSKKNPPPDFPGNLKPNSYLQEFGTEEKRREENRREDNHSQKNKNFSKNGSTSEIKRFPDVPSPSPKKTRRSSYSILFTFKNDIPTFSNIPPALIQKWKETFPDIDVDRAISETALFWSTQPVSRHKKNWAAALFTRLSWLQDNRDKLALRGSSQPMSFEKIRELELLEQRTKRIQYLEELDKANAAAGDKAPGEDQ